MASPTRIPVPGKPISVVNPLFCSPQPIHLTLTRNAFSVDVSVTDVNGNIIFLVKGSTWGFSKHRVLYNVAGNPLVYMEPKHFSAHRRWRAYRGNSSDSRELFSVRKSSLLQLGTRKLDVFMADNTSEENCDFKIKWNSFDKSCTIYEARSEIIVAQMSKRYTVKNMFLGKNALELTVYPGVDYAFIAALVVIVDQIDRDIRNSNNNHHHNMHHHHMHHHNMHHHHMH